jgi:arabinogalactan endo-1,4-beta-galactosidase
MKLNENNMAAYRNSKKHRLKVLTFSRAIIIIICTVLTISGNAQNFFFGADLSYVNEMQNCGVSYSENEIIKDPFLIFSDNGCNLVRLRLWHTPSWYDNLNDGMRFSDLDDVKLSIARSKQNNLNVLLDFHLSDNWADPSKQLVPDAWLPVVDDVEILKDSLYNYIFSTLSELHQENLLPEMIQIGNETNKGILLSPSDNATWTLDWTRNAILFNAAIKAVRDVEIESNSEIMIVLHVAGPVNAEWLIDGFIDNGVTDFDFIGLSYYWAWHKPTNIQETGEIIENLKFHYPDKEVIIVETGYIWTNEWNDSASNIITETHPDYHPASPIAQRDWLIDLTKEVIASNGSGVVYWEPAWVSSSCFTQWGQGSHQEHATFFDFENNLLIPGGIEWMNYDYADINTAISESPYKHSIQILINTFSGNIKIKQDPNYTKTYQYILQDSTGQVLVKASFSSAETSFHIDNLPHGTYIISVQNDGVISGSKLFVYGSG